MDEDREAAADAVPVADQDARALSVPDDVSMLRVVRVLLGLIDVEREAKIDVDGIGE